MICKMEGLSLRAVSSHITEKEISIDSYVDFFGEKKVKRLKRSTGVEFVHVVSHEETASDLCVKAAENLFEKEKISRDSIDGIVFVSCGKFFGIIDKFRKNILKTYTKGSIYRKQYLNIIEASKYFFDA